MLNNIPLIIYLSELCQSINVTLAILVSVLYLASIILVIYICDGYESRGGDGCKIFLKPLKILVASAIICTIGFIACPSKKVVYTYLGIATIESIANNKAITGEAAEIYKDVKKLIHSYVRNAERQKNAEFNIEDEE